MNRLPLHEALKPLAWLEGTWRTETPGSGIFPTIKPFKYCEEIIFSSIGQPMFNYVAQSWHPDTKKPMHREVGFLKVIPNTNKLSFLLSHNFGVTSIEEGELQNENTICLNTTNIIRPQEGVKPPEVLKLQREFNLLDGYLHHTLYMATSTTPELTKHLSAQYKKEI